WPVYSFRRLWNPLLHTLSLWRTGAPFSLSFCPRPSLPNTLQRSGASVAHFRKPPTIYSIGGSSHKVCRFNKKSYRSRNIVGLTKAFHWGLRNKRLQLVLSIRFWRQHWPWGHGVNLYRWGERFGKRLR